MYYFNIPNKSQSHRFILDVSPRIGKGIIIDAGSSRQHFFSFAFLMDFVKATIVQPCIFLNGNRYIDSSNFTITSHFELILFHRECVIVHPVL